MTIVVDVLVVLVALALIAWLISPLETLIWWQRDGAEATARAKDEFTRALPNPSPAPSSPTGAPDQDAPHCYLLYLSGIAAFDDDFLPRAERPILRRLERSFANLTVVGTIYPYAADNRSLIDDRPSSPIWKWVASKQGSRRWTGVISMLINLRNAYQVLVSADPRYGPVFSAGVAQSLWKQLAAAGYQPGSRANIVLLGWSGGAQIAAGAAWYLGSAGARVSLISLGGILTADPGLRRCQEIVHLVGTKDWQTRWFAPVLFPSRRRWARHSAWREAISEGRLTQHMIGPFRHVGRGSYLSGARLDDGRTCSQVTSEAIAKALVEADLATLRPDDQRAHHG